MIEIIHSSSSEFQFQRYAVEIYFRQLVHLKSNLT